MKFPKYKPTKWKVEHCLDCNKIASRYVHYCKRQSHKIVERENIPFFVPDMEIEQFYDWSILKSASTGLSYPISITNMSDVVCYTTIEKGIIKDQWWMFCKVGSSYSLRLVPNEDEEE